MPNKSQQPRISKNNESTRCINEPNTADASSRFENKAATERQSTRMMVWLTAVIAISTVIYSIISYFQWTAARRSADIAEQSVRLGNRAYFGLRTMMLDDPLATNRKTGVKGVFKNAGQTPAFNVVVKSYYLFSEQPFKADPKDQLAASPSQIGLVLPNEDFNYTFVIPPLSDIQINKINHGLMKLFLYGFIEYEDVFHEQHTMKFCGVYSPTEFTGFFRCPSNNNEE